MKINIEISVSRQYPPTVQVVLSNLEIWFSLHLGTAPSLVAGLERSVEAVDLVPL
jgi:hypothetical protein